MKTAWIIDHYSSEPQYGGISRQYDFATELGKKGVNVVVMASGFSHFTHSHITDREMLVNKVSPNVHYVYLKTPGYQANGGAGRAMGMVGFMLKVLKHEAAIAKKYGAPDVVTGCSVHPLAWVAAYRIARKYHVRFCAEVRDFWPRVWVAAGEKKPFDPLVVSLGWLQNWIYKKADRIIYSMQHGDKYICGELGFDSNKTYLIGQPMDCLRYDKNKEMRGALPEQIRAFMDGSFVCSFAGYYMKYEGVYTMLKAAKALKGRGLPIKMVFVGSGPEKEGMEAYADAEGLDNVLVYGRVPKEAVPALLGGSKVCMAHLEVEGHKEVYQYGVSKNKVNEYLYSGVCTLYGFLHRDDAVAKCGGGIMFEPHDAVDLANKIEGVYRMDGDRQKMFGINGRKYIQENHSVGVLADRLMDVLFGG